MSKKPKKPGATERKTFKYSLLSAAVSAAIAGGHSAPAIAQDDNDENDSELIEEIVVQGQRANLVSATNMKENADTVMDALAADDITALSDRSILEALSRVPGVAIERFKASVDPDHFGVEGGAMVVRGLTHTRSEFNHRDAITAGSRGLSFQDVSPEMIGSVEVFKNQTASNIEGGIAGVVNLNTRKPFDSSERLLAFSADATYTDFREESVPTFSGLFSDVWDIDSGRIGFLFSYADSEVSVRSDAAQIGRYYPQVYQIDGQDVYVPNSMRVARKLDDVNRKGLVTSLQWENTDGTVVLTGEYIRSKTDRAWTENSFESAFDPLDYENLLPVAGTEFEFDDSGYYENGVMTSNQGWRGDTPGGRYGQKHQLVTRAATAHSTVEDINFNAKFFTPDDKWAFQFDVQYVDGESGDTDVSLMAGAYAVVDLDVSTGGMPSIFLRHPAYDGQADFSPASTQPFIDPDFTFHRSAMDHVSDNTGESFAAQFDTEYMFDDSVVDSVEFGARYSDRETDAKFSTYNWGGLSEAWNFPGQKNFFSEFPEVPTDVVSFNDFSRGGVLQMEGGSNDIRFMPMSIAKDYANLQAALSPVNVGGWRPVAERPGTVGHFLPGEIFDTAEEGLAAYVKFNFAGDFNGKEWSGNLGLRHVSRDLTSNGAYVFPDNVPIDPNDPTEIDNLLPADQQAFGNAASQELGEAHDYSTVLPSLNFRVNLTEDFIVRFGLSKAITLPTLTHLQNYVPISGTDLTIEYDPVIPPSGEPVPVSAEYGRYIARSGNPSLKPIEAINYDLSFEWYFGDGNSLTAALFYKDLKNFWVNGVTLREFTNNGATQVVEVGRPQNGDKGTVEGAEIAYQQFYDDLPGWLGGFGVRFGYTFIGEDGAPNDGLHRDNLDGFAFEGMPLEGLSEHNSNASLLYEKYGVTANIAYNWRSEYLLTTRDVITKLPIYHKPGGQLDASFFWDVTDNLKIGLQTVNLNNNVYETRMQVNQEGLKKARSFFTTDRRYSFVIRGSF